MNLQSAVDARRRALDWGIVGTVVAVVSILAAMGSWIQVARRPVPTPEPAFRPGAITSDTASEPGPSERVRELVRRRSRSRRQCPSALDRAGRAASDDNDSSGEFTRHERLDRRPPIMRQTTAVPSASRARAVPTTMRFPPRCSPVRKAAIVLVSLDQSLASQLLSHLDRPAVEAVTWEIARLERVDPADRAAVLEEFYGLGLRRLCFVFDDLVKMADGDLRAAFHDEDLETWSLALAGAAAPVRAKVLAALSVRVRRAGCDIILTAWARSGSPIPKRPRSRSPSACAGFTIAAASACRSRAGATRFSSRKDHGPLAREEFRRGQEARGIQQRICRCANRVEGIELCVAALGLAIILALGFAADAIVLMTTRAHADAAGRFRNGRERPATDLGRSERRSVTTVSGCGVRAAARRSRAVASDALPPPGERIAPGRLGSVVARA